MYKKFTTNTKSKKIRGIRVPTKQELIYRIYKYSRPEFFARSEYTTREFRLLQEFGRNCLKPFVPNIFGGYVAERIVLWGCYGR